VSGGPTGAHILLEAARAQGFSVCFANPGTTELSLVRALADVPEIRPVLSLFEGVCAGAADGYARVTGQAALTLLHLGPGLANGIANLHNARRARSPIVNLVGDHARWHLPYDAPLTSDISALAHTVGQVIRMKDIGRVARDIAHASATAAEGVVVSVIIPTDVMDAADATQSEPFRSTVRARGAVTTTRLDKCATALTRDGPVILLLGGEALRPEGQRDAARIAAATGARLLMETYPAIVSLGGDLPRLERLAYFPDDVLRQLDGARVILAGTRAPVSYFGYEGYPSLLVPDSRLTSLVDPGEDVLGALAALAARFQQAAPAAPAAPASAPTPSEREQGAALTPAAIIETLVEQLPDDAIISLEGSTLGGPWLQQAHRARRHRVMTNTGGAIGQGLPCAVGAAIGRPDARVVALQSDGSAQYTLQALWTMAREQLDVTIILAANHRYGILQTELKRTGADLAQPVLDRLTDLGEPCIDWVDLAQGYGVPAVRAETAAEFSSALKRGLSVKGPFLIEATLP
jgi:acetolactate synthase-1/2/3 large subunit